MGGLALRTAALVCAVLFGGWVAVSAHDSLRGQVRSLRQSLEPLPPNEDRQCLVVCNPSERTVYLNLPPKRLPTPSGLRIQAPNWEAAPGEDAILAAYPVRAWERRRGGSVVLDCVVEAEGSLYCRVVSEDPRGWGFGPAALQISKSFRMAPQLEDGQPTEGGLVRVPLRFNPGLTSLQPT